MGQADPGALSVRRDGRGASPRESGSVPSALSSLDLSRPFIKIIHQPERFRVWKNTWLHLVHDVGESHSVFRIAEAQAAARAGLTEAVQFRTKYLSDLSVSIERILHEANAERRVDPEDLIRARALRGRNSLDRFGGEDLVGTNRLVESRQRIRRADPAQGRNRKSA